VVSACLRDKRLNSREESLSPFTRLTATIDWYTGSFSDRLLEQLQVVRYRMHGKTIVQSTQVTAPMADILRNLGVPLPKRILEVSDEAHTSSLP
jgi:hypothetical protein